MIYDVFVCFCNCLPEETIDDSWTVYVPYHLPWSVVVVVETEQLAAAISQEEHET